MHIGGELQTSQNEPAAGNLATFSGVLILLPTQHLGLIMLDKSHTNLGPCACYSCLYPDYNWKKNWLIIPLTHWTTTTFFSIADKHHYFSPETVKSLWETSTKLIIKVLWNRSRCE